LLLCFEVGHHYEDNLSCVLNLYGVLWQVIAIAAWQVIEKVWL